MSSLVRTIWRRQHRSSDRAEAHRAAQPPSTVITVLFTMLPASKPDTPKLRPPPVSGQGDLSGSFTSDSQRREREWKT